MTQAPPERQEALRTEAERAREYRRKLAKRRPTKTELEEPITIHATPEQVADAIVADGVPRRESGRT